MSPSNSRLLLLFLAVAAAFLASTASARPCKTFFISSYSFSIRPLYPNPNHRSSSAFVAIVTEFTQQSSSSSSEIFLSRRIFPAVEEYSQPREIRRDESDGPLLLPFGLSSSFRDRAKDILSVVVALLFGVGCGALTAATMYLVWSIFANRFGISEYEFEGGFEDEDFDESPKKAGYVQVPPADFVPKAV